MLKKLSILIYFAILILINLFFFNITFVFGDSMSDALNDKNIVLTYKFNPVFENGDIVVTNKSNLLENNLIKRVVAVGGQRIVIQNKRLIVDDEVIPFYDGITSKNVVDIIVPENSYFLIGDNFAFSKDSRDIGVVEKKDIIGEVLLKLIPLESL